MRVIAAVSQSWQVIAGLFVLRLQCSVLARGAVARSIVDSLSLRRAGIAITTAAGLLLFNEPFRRSRSPEFPLSFRRGSRLAGA